MSVVMPARNSEGFLENPEAWTPPVAERIAAESDIALNDAHWEIIHMLRDFYAEHEMAPPAARFFVKAVKQHFGEEKGNSIYLMQLFPGTSAVKVACRIAGLPRPTNCL
ncbi:TusE/DsrC/DsvC family sulfur relay protein [Marinobacter sp. R17]|uniref:TusE/DsrC/DsvC family sulfur relay protein n=1 Tax=Marinobacter TaxID=2742 RepID=UPI000F4B7620|nr:MULTISPECIES: TusE/DsrC/DsvC family sulfur relay protein [Marinobacter]ROU00037.1 TusE/DsrC/DsvC family sulfur relay protein [Marinobacter sp. R17]